MKPLVSVIIVNWDGEQVVGECLNSIKALEYKPVEVIVVDNGSKDRSKKILDGYGNTIRVIWNENNEGYIKGANCGIKTAKGKYIATLNNDMVVDKDWLKGPIELLEKEPSIGMVSCKQMYYSSKDMVDSLFQYLGKRLYCIRFGHDRPCQDVPMAYVLAPNGGSAIYRAELFQQLGPFKEIYDAYHEECDFALRALLEGWRCAYSPGATVYHRVNFSFRRQGGVSRYLHERNRYLFALNNFPMSFLFRHAWRFILGELKDLLLCPFSAGGIASHLKSRIAVLKYLFSGQWRDSQLARRFKAVKPYFVEIWKKKYLPLQG